MNTDEAILVVEADPVKTVNLPFQWSSSPQHSHPWLWQTKALRPRHLPLVWTWVSPENAAPQKNLFTIAVYILLNNNIILLTSRSILPSHIEVEVHFMHTKQPCSFPGLFAFFTKVEKRKKPWEQHCTQRCAPHSLRDSQAWQALKRAGEGRGSKISMKRVLPWQGKWQLTFIRNNADTTCTTVNFHLIWETWYGICTNHTWCWNVINYVSEVKYSSFLWKYYFKK